jgi:hypothetical protein
MGRGAHRRPGDFGKRQGQGAVESTEDIKINMTAWKIRTVIHLDLGNRI